MFSAINLIASVLLNLLSALPKIIENSSHFYWDINFDFSISASIFWRDSLFSYSSSMRFSYRDSYNLSDSIYYSYESISVIFNVRFSLNVPKRGSEWWLLIDLITPYPLVDACIYEVPV